MKLSKHIINSELFPPITHYGSESEAKRVRERLKRHQTVNLTSWERTNMKQSKAIKATEKQYDLVWDLYNKFRVYMQRKHYIAKIATDTKLPQCLVKTIVCEMRKKALEQVTVKDIGL